MSMNMWVYYGVSVFIGQLFRANLEFAAITGFPGDPLDGIVFDVEKGSQGFGKALFVLFEGLVGSFFDAKTAGFCVH